MEHSPHLFFPQPVEWVKNVSDITPNLQDWLLLRRENATLKRSHGFGARPRFHCWDLHFYVWEARGWWDLEELHVTFFNIDLDIETREGANNLLKCFLQILKASDLLFQFSKQKRVCWNLSVWYLSGANSSLVFLCILNTFFTNFKMKTTLEMFIFVLHKLEYKIFIFAESVHNLGMCMILLKVDFFVIKFFFILKKIIHKNNNISFSWFHLIWVDLELIWFTVPPIRRTSVLSWKDLELI